jgi:hypothetical protein
MTGGKKECIFAAKDNAKNVRGVEQQRKKETEKDRQKLECQ